MEKASTDIRLRYLAVSGGWLGSLVISAANTFGIFDILVLAVIGVLWYLIVRMSMSELAIILGFYLDGVIPLQYYQNEDAYLAHKDHLDDYWPLFLASTAAEAGLYLLLDSNSFTLIVCLKSLALSFIWMGRRKDGVFVRPNEACLTQISTAIRQGKLAKPSSIPLGGNTWTSNSTPAVLPPFWVDPRHPKAEEQLRAKYTDPLVRWGMLHELCRTKPDDKAKEKIGMWRNTPYSASRAKRMAEAAKKVIASGSTRQR